MNTTILHRRDEKRGVFRQVDFCEIYNESDIIILENQKDKDFLNEDLLNKKIKLNELIFCTSGEMFCEFNGVSQFYSQNSVLTVPSHYILDYCLATPDAKIINVCFSSRISKFFTSLWNRTVYKDKLNYIQLSDYDMKNIIFIFNIIKDMLSHKLDKYGHKIIKMNISIIFCIILRYIENQDIGEEHKNTSYRGSILFERFLDVLSTTTPKRHTVGYYAEQLSITSNYLSVICSKCSNKSVKEWIEEFVKEEVRSYLMQFNLSIKEVAHITGFDNLSFFTRYVKKSLGCTPTEYRKKYKQI